MRLLLLKPTQTLKKSYAKQGVVKTQLDVFRRELTRLLAYIDEKEPVEFQKNIIARFLSESLYKQPCTIQLAGNTELLISHEQTNRYAPAALVVVKRVYGAEMMMPLKPNVRALHELILSYFDACEQPDRVVHHLIATDAYNWFVFDAINFHRIFYENARLRRLYQLKQHHQKDNQFFYSEAAKILRDLMVEVPVTFVNLREAGEWVTGETAEALRHLIPIYKLLSPEHILKLAQRNGQAHGKAFYEGLLSIFGLPLAPDANTPSAEKLAFQASINEDEVTTKLQRGTEHLSRLLLQKLARTRLVDEHVVNFLVADTGSTDATFSIEETEKLATFLDTYAFGFDGATGLLPENKPFLTTKTVGQVLEKLNGYQADDFTALDLLTTSMIRDVLRRTVIQRFNEQYNWPCISLEELQRRVERISFLDANQVVNSLRICAPAVGSGHFLASALNELIVIKAELGILYDQKGRSLRKYAFKVEDDELFVSNAEGQLFDYQPPINPGRPTEVQRVHQALFHEKLTLLENCIFGVDTSPLAVSLCKLRLQMELFTSAYVGMEIRGPGLNLTIGNSLVSRGEVDDKPIMERLQRLSAEYVLKYQTNQLFQIELTPLQVKDRAKRQRDIARLETKLREQTNEEVYGQAVDWALMFPALQDKQGNFSGFDVIIGQPPYQPPANWSAFGPYLRQTFPEIYSARGPSYLYFIAQGMRLLREKGHACWLLPKDWLTRAYAAKFRRWLQFYDIQLLVDFGDLPVINDTRHQVCVLTIRRAAGSATVDTACMEPLKWMGADFSDLVTSYLVESSFAQNK